MPSKSLLPSIVYLLRLRQRKEPNSSTTITADTVVPTAIHTVFLLFDLSTANNKYELEDD